MGEKYLQYGTVAGWSNQLMCLKHAVQLANALNRTLVLPPPLPHFLTGIPWYDAYPNLEDTYLISYFNPRTWRIYIPPSLIYDMAKLESVVRVIDFRDLHQQEQY